MHLFSTSVPCVIPGAQRAKFSITKLDPSSPEYFKVEEYFKASLNNHLDCYVKVFGYCLCLWGVLTLLRCLFCRSGKLLDCAQSRFGEFDSPA